MFHHLYFTTCMGSSFMSGIFFRSPLCVRKVHSVWWWNLGLREWSSLIWGEEKKSKIKFSPMECLLKKFPAEGSGIIFLNYWTNPPDYWKVFPYSKSELLRYVSKKWDYFMYIVCMTLFGLLYNTVEWYTNFININH